MARRGSFIEKAELDATGFQTEDEALKQTLADPALMFGSAVSRYDETVNSWKKPTALKECKIRLDPLRHHLQIQNSGLRGETETFVPDELIDFHKMTDVRSRPYTLDETKNSADWLIQPKDYSRFFMIAYYPNSHFDYVKVSFISVLCSDEETAEKWKAALQALIGYNTQWSTRMVSFQEKLARIYSAAMARAQPDADEGIPIEHVRDVFGKARRNEVSAVLKTMKLITKTKKSGKFVDSKQLTTAVFEQIAEQVLPFKAVKEAFSRVVTKRSVDGRIDAARLLKLLQDEHRDQRENEILTPVPTEATVTKLLNTYEESEEGRESGLLSFEGFKHFLLSEDGQAINPAHLDRKEDLSKPLSHYYINSSHNTYLLGGQLKSKSCAEIYRQTILSGCRCVELDAWDGDDGEPVITHGNTFCTKMPFKDAVDAIAQVAWVRSDLPIILSYENHCSVPQQKKVTLYTWGAFKEDLSSEFLPGDGPAHLPRQLPSPEQMKRKVIIKNKRRTEDQLGYSGAGGAAGNAGTGTSLDVGSDSSSTRESVQMDGIMHIEVDGEIVTETQEEYKDRQSRTKPVAPELSSIVNYVWPINFKGFEKARAANCCYHMSSFNERKGARFVAGQPEEYTDYCKNQISRIYPHGTRVNSSNYNPQIYWNVGAQLVALNFQTMGTAPMQINEGKFMVNSRSGYCLKPLMMRDSTKNFNPFASIPIAGIVPMDIKVEVLGAHFIASTGNPTVEMQLVGLPHDTSKVRKTKAYRGEGEPVWTEDNVLEVSQVIMPDIALLRIAVEDAQESLGWVTVPMDSIRPGYRIFPLRFARSELAYVVVKIDLKISNGRFADFADMLYNPTAYASSTTAKNMAAIADLLVPEMPEEIDEDSGPSRRKAFSAATSTAAAGGGSSGDSLLGLGGGSDGDEGALGARASVRSYGGMSARPSGMIAENDFSESPASKGMRGSGDSEPSVPGPRSAGPHIVLDSFKRQLTDEMLSDHKLTTGEALTYYRKMLVELDASKPVVSANAAFAKSAAKLTATYSKANKALAAEHNKRIADIIKRGTAQCKKLIAGASLDAARLEVHVELLHEIETTADKMLAGMEAMLTHTDALKVKLNTQLNAARSKALKAWQDVRMKRLKKLIKSAGANAMGEAKAGFRKQNFMLETGKQDASTSKKDTLKAWTKMQEEHNKNIIRASVDANMDRADAHASQTAWLGNLSSDTVTATSDAHSKLIAQIKSMHSRCMDTLKLDQKKVSEPGWDSMSAAEFVADKSLPCFKTYSIAE